MSHRESSPTTVSVQHTVDVQVTVKDESPSLPSPTASAAPNSEAPSSPTSRPPRRTLAQRRAFLRDDPLSGEVEAHRVYCRGCEKWIRLASSTEYTVTNWQTHKARCRGSLQNVRRTPSKRSFSPSSRIATTERKILLLNDPQVKDVSATHVHCGTCKTPVALEGDVDYDLTKWTEHKEKCIPKIPAPITPQGSRPHIFPPASTSSTHSQASIKARSSTPAGEGSQSTETTAVTESSPSAVNIGVKRARDEEEEEAELVKDERPTNRPRTDTDKPPEKDVPGLFGMLMQPLKEFARGFREGLGS